MLKGREHTVLEVLLIANTKTKKERFYSLPKTSQNFLLKKCVLLISDAGREPRVKITMNSVSTTK